MDNKVALGKVFIPPHLSCVNWEPPVAQPDFPIPDLGLPNIGADECFEYFSNGLGLEAGEDGGMKGIVETRKRKATFLASGKWDPSLNVAALPFFYARRRKIHHFADIYATTSIVAKELGFKDAIHYIRCRGWTLKVWKNSDPRLAYRRVQDIFETATTKGRATLFLRFNTMVYALYKALDDQVLKSVYSKKPALRFMKESSFISKLHSHAQDLQIAVIIVENFFMPVVPQLDLSAEERTLPHQMKEIFCNCDKRKDMIEMFQHCFECFPDKGDREFAIFLLTKTPTTIRDEVKK